MTDRDDVPPEVERRLGALEERMDVAAADAAAARHLAAARDRDLADLGVKVDAHRRVINAMGQQLNGRIDGLSGRVDALSGRVDALSGRVDELSGRVDVGFAATRAGFDAMAAGQQTIVGLLTRLIDEPPAV